MQNYSTGYAFDSDVYSEEGVPLIRITNIQDGRLELAGTKRIPAEKIPANFKDYANENDILISMSGSIGLSCVIPSEIKAVVNQRIMRITQNVYYSNVLSLIINSPIVREQLVRIGTGGVQTNISATDIGNVLIPLLDNATQELIASHVQESFTLRRKSEELIKAAVHAVEIAIEQGEAVAMEYVREL